MNAAARRAPEGKRRLSILIADDDEDTVKTLAAILTDEGHVVHTVTHGALVDEAVRRFKPEVCILDIEMPGKSGYTCAGDIVAQYREKRPMLIGISGKWFTQTDQLLARSVGFDHFFRKPADPQQLCELLQEPWSGPEAA